MIALDRTDELLDVARQPAPAGEPSAGRGPAVALERAAEAQRGPSPSSATVASSRACG